MGRIFKTPSDDAVEEVEETPEEKFRTEIELKPEEKIEEEIFKESIKIEKKSEFSSRSCHSFVQS